LSIFFGWNWNQEISKWLKGLHSKTIFVKSSQKDKQVYDFIQGHSSTHPLLVISYENFRSVAGHLNKLRNWETIICDEGHRLKNAELTQTSLALVNCVAQRRLVLTGTPIQNNLDELFTVINFVCPGYFGTLEEFTSNFSDPIMLKGGDARTQATNNMKQQLKRILLRRVRDDILSEMLPPRTGYTIYCPLNASQRIRYLGQADRLLEGLKMNAKPKADTRSTKSTKSAEDSRKMIETNGWSSDDDSDDEEEEGEEKAVVEGDKQVQKGDIDAAGPDGLDSLKKASSRKRHLPCGENKVKESQVLPALMELRLTSNTSSAFGADASSKDATESTASDVPEVIAGESSTTKNEDKESRLAKAKVVVERSGKMAVLDTLLTAIKAGSSDTEKAVVVSNFQNVLGEVEALARGRGWHILRIDGDVPAEKRMKLVAHFNNPSSPFFLMLLSARAGGVGLNLVGGSRLVLVDPDWNPATDQQAMGRIWRDGQTKPVFIYRLISAGSIDETILSRQQKKGTLNAVISVQGNDEQRADYDGSNPSKKVGNGDIHAMIFPRGKDYVSRQPTLLDGASQTDPVLKELSSLCVEIAEGL
jgi:SNF2 family DNA or RNA helicase